MDLYTQTSYELSRHLTLKYSTSFGQSSKLFSRDIQADIFAIYGFVRIADEIVDTYSGDDTSELLDSLEAEAYRSLKTGYSTNPIVHAFCVTAVKYNISKDLIAPFFDSMRMDLVPQTYTATRYKKYIYGSAEVVGLMCLKVFCQNDEALYNTLTPGAKALGAAYQKVNFLRDIASDFDERGRVYFPKVTFEQFTDTEKAAIEKDIRSDFKKAAEALPHLPLNARNAVTLSYVYYQELLKKIEKTPASVLKHTRVRVPDGKKLYLLAHHIFSKGRPWQK